MGASRGPRASEWGLRHRKIAVGHIHVTNFDLGYILAPPSNYAAKLPHVMPYIEWDFPLKYMVAGKKFGTTAKTVYDHSDDVTVRVLIRHLRTSH